MVLIKITKTNSPKNTSKKLGMLNTPTDLSRFHPKLLSLDETLHFILIDSVIYLVDHFQQNAVVIGSELSETLSCVEATVRASPGICAISAILVPLGMVVVSSQRLRSCTKTLTPSGLTIALATMHAFRSNLLFAVLHHPNYVRCC